MEKVLLHLQSMAAKMESCFKILQRQMDYFGGKLVSVDQQFGDLNTGIGKQKINSEHLRAKVNALQTVLSAVMKDNMPLHFKREAEKHSIKSENGQVQGESE